MAWREFRRADLASLDAGKLKEKLDWLVRMQIVEESNLSSVSTPDSIPSTVYSIHPAVRDGFLSGISRGDRVACHEAIRKGLEVSLGAARGGKPSDRAALDLLEEIVHHALETGNVRVAWEIYQNRLGGCRNLIAGLNDYVRAARVTESIIRAHETSDALPDNVVVILRSDFGYSSLELGNIARAATSLSRGLKLCQRTKDSNLQVLASNLVMCVD